MIDALWAPGGDELGLDPDEDAYAEYFKRTEALGFGTQDDCQRAWRLACEELEDEINGGLGWDESDESDGNEDDKRNESTHEDLNK